MTSIKSTVVTIFTVILLCIACRHSTVTSEVDTSIITPVTITTISLKPVTETIMLPAVTSFLNKNTVRSLTAGTIENISIKPGEYVRKGQLLVSLRTRESDAMANSLKNDSTFSFKGRIDVNSPASGVVSSVLHQTGDFVQEGDEIAIIADENSLVFILDTPFDFVKYIENNKTCKIQLPDNQIITGNIIRKLPEMDPEAQTVKYVINPVYAGHLPANMNALITIVKSSRGNAIMLPKTAVLGNETLTEFWVMKLINDSTAIKVPVKKGFEDNTEVEITDPEFRPDDRIIVTGNYGLPDTAKVIIK